MHRQERHWDFDDRIQLGEAYSVGPRTYELAACGLYQISDGERPELQEIFGDTIPTFSTPEQLEREVRWALANPHERRQQARRQHAAVQGHSVTDRMRTLLDCLTAGKED